MSSIFDIILLLTFICARVNVDAFRLHYTKPTFSSSSSALALREDGIIDVVEISSTESLKCNLHLLAARTSRGEIATVTDRDSADRIVSELESQYKSSPSSPGLIEGTWELVYASTYLFRSSPFFMAARAVCKEGEEADRFNWFCKQHREALAFTSIGPVRQIISRDKLVSEFESNVAAVPGLPIIIKGTIVSTADIESFEEEQITLFMDSVKIKAGSSNIPILSGYLDEFSGLNSRALGSFLESISASYKNPKPVFRTYYVDKEMRISRDQDDNVFVYTRVV